jgi:hypothetical protein
LHQALINVFICSVCALVASRNNAGEQFAICHARGRGDVLARCGDEGEDAANYAIAVCL